ncbi:MAG TPA: glycerophosphodiester phosphodiesterase [Pyrinomonadaceae bacterium]|nr:glycerophosphodiester phosphodiesterase [Pyrinomonadaceae bacterium]
MREPLIIGHRGASAVAPENSIAAFEAAIAAGADGIEFDVRLSRDGVPVIIHDDTLQRTHGLRGRVVDSSADELGSVGVPSLRDLFELMSQNDLILYLEIKGSSAALAERCCELVSEFSYEDRVIVECFDLNVIKNIRTLKTAALFEPRIYTDQRVIDRTLEARASVLALHHRLAKSTLVEKAKLAGLRVVVWTVDDPAWIARAQAMGIEALITNDPATMIEASDRLRVELNQ